MISLEDAKNLRYGDMLVDSRGSRWKVNGEVKTWKTDERRIRVPLKHGLYDYSYIKTEDFDKNGICNLLTKEA